METGLEGEGGAEEAPSREAAGPPPPPAPQQQQQQEPQQWQDPPGYVEAWRGLQGPYVHGWMLQIRDFCTDGDLFRLRRAGDTGDEQDSDAESELPPAELWERWGLEVYTNPQLAREFELPPDDASEQPPQAVVAAITRAAMTDGYEERAGGVAGEYA